MEQNSCPVCGTQSEYEHQFDPVAHFWSCPVCGRFQYFPQFSDLDQFNLNHLSSYLAYNGFTSGLTEHRYFSTMTQERCDQLKGEFEAGHTHAYPIKLSPEDVESWYPKSLAEKIDLILLYLYRHTEFIGDIVCFPEEQMYSWLFVDRFENAIKQPLLRRSSEQLHLQAMYMLNYLCDTKKYVISAGGDQLGKKVVLSASGLSRVEKLQANVSNSKTVLVAMQFGEETKPLREAIRQGIRSSQYVAIFIDEVEHNDFITPELLKYIRDSKFVVVELTHRNNGAYFEEGYAMGLGKPVIQLCKRGVTLHFDIAQKNTIIWETEEEIPERLRKRILATIE